MMGNTILRALYLIALLVLTIGCEKDENEPQSDYFIFPIGRSFLNSGSLDVNIDYTTGPVFDSCGGYWLHIPKSEMSNTENLVITITRKKEDLELFSEIVGHKQEWLNPSYYIDSDHEQIISKARELTEGLSARIEKAKAIQQYVIRHVELNIYKDSFLEKASKTNELAYGTCMNFSRLYVALCRAANIPARTIWGIVYGYNNDSIYDYHHQWAEILDESGYWHPSDFSYSTKFDLNDIRYLDLIYAAEENSIFF